MNKTVYYIEGDGIGPEIWRAALPVMNAAVAAAYSDGRSLVWKELLAGEKAERETGSLLPEATLETLRGAELGMKGPLSTPVGKGFRSLNVTLRQTLDLFACIRPVRHVPGVASPLKHPELVDMVVFRENTEDVYAGIEFASETPEARRLIAFLRDELGADVDPASGVGIKPISERCSKRLVRKALDFALAQNRRSLTLVHKGNIMKYTEGAFRQWGYDLAAADYADRVISENDAASGGTGESGLILKDRIADAMFQEALLHPEQYDVLATTNLNGDYLSDALAAQVGGLGIAPGVNMSDDIAIFEATHGTAPTIAGKDMANPTSLLLSGAMLFDHIGWNEAGDRLRNAIEKAVTAKFVTPDLASQIENATAVGCAEYGDRVGSLL